MTPSPRLLALALGAVAALALGGCSSAAPETTSTFEAGAPACHAGPPAGGDFCSDLDAIGATGASFGTVPLYLEKESLAATLDDELEVLAVTPPEEIAEAWSSKKDYYERMRAAVEALPAGGTLSDPAISGESAEHDVETEQITDYYFDNC
jgi:hypothetical protein